MTKCKLLVVGCCVFLAGVVARADTYPVSEYGFWISPQKVPFAQAAAVVASYEGKFSDLTDENFLLVASYVFSTLGPDSSVWIHSWNGNTYAGAPLEFALDHDGVGSIAIGSAEAIQNVLVYQPQIVPEPSTAALTSLGFGGLWLLCRRGLCRGTV